MILGAAALFWLLNLVWGWTSWQVSLTVLIAALAIETLLGKAREARKRRRFREALGVFVDPEVRAVAERKLAEKEARRKPKPPDNVTPIK